jgi:hypothetical protein
MAAGDEEWNVAFSRAFAVYPSLERFACPNCGEHRIHMAFAGLPESGAASGVIWCSACLTGHWVSRSSIPDGAVVFALDDRGIRLSVAYPEVNRVRFV